MYSNTTGAVRPLTTTFSHCSDTKQLQLEQDCLLNKAGITRVFVFTAVTLTLVPSS